MSWLLPSMQLFMASFFLAITGRMVANTIPDLWFNRYGRHTIAHDVFVGQITFMIIVYIRSFVNYLFNIILPITIIDFLVFIVVIYIVNHHKNQFKLSKETIKNHIIYRSELLIILFLITINISVRELPRLIMLSSDPDLHAFWAHQIKRLGTLPYFDQSHWGTVGFMYPGGFSVLNHVWSTLSFLDIRNIVTAQTLLQANLAVLMILEAVVAHNDTASRKLTILTSMIVFTIYYTYIPYGYQQATYHLEGTGRFSSIIFIAVVISFMLSVVGEENSKTKRWIFVNNIFLGMNICFSITINILNAPYIIILTIIGIAISLRYNRWSQSTLSLAGLSTSLLFIIDPYYLSRIFLNNHQHVVNYQNNSTTSISLRDAYINSIQPRNLSLLTDRMLETTLLSGRQAVLLFGYILIIISILLPLKTIKPKLIFVGFLLSIISIMGFLFITPLAEVLGSRGADHYLIPPYIENNRQQVVILCLFTLIIIITSAIIQKLSNLSMLFLFFGIALVALFGNNEKITSTSRRNYPGSMGNLTRGDLNIIRFVENKYLNFSKNTSKLNHTTIPKILVPNHVLKLGREQWLFPHGAARILPLYDVFPLAFYYFQGSPDYTFSSYVEHVCNKFDREWLLSRGIRYLFIPSDRGQICLHDLDRIINTCHVLAHDEGAFFCDLDNMTTEQVRD